MHAVPASSPSYFATGSARGSALKWVPGMLEHLTRGGAATMWLVLALMVFGSVVYA